MSSTVGAADMMAFLMEEVFLKVIEIRGEREHQRGRSVAPGDSGPVSRAAVGWC